MTVYAFTELHNDYPAYVNLSEQDGGLKLSVRTRGNGGKEYASIALTDTQAEELAEAVFKHVYAADAPGAPAAILQTTGDLRVIPDSECAQGRCANWTTGCRGVCGLKLVGYTVAAPLPAAPAPTEQAERHLFEDTYARLHRCTPGGGWNDRSSVSGHYEEVDTQDAWILWSAALAARQAPTASDSAPIPKSVEQAQLMANLGLMWLRDHAPEKLVGAPDSRDAARLDYIERWSAKNKERGFHWNTLAFSVDKPARDQLDEAIAQEKAQ